MPAMSWGWPMRPERRLRFDLLSHIALSDASRVRSFRFDHAGLDGMTRIRVAQVPSPANG